MPATRIQGAKFEDHRGEMVFCNDLNLSAVQRFYRIKPADTTLVRGWQGHHKESKWFHCVRGSFVLNTVRVENFDSPDESIRPDVYNLQADSPEVVHVSGGMCTAIKASAPDSELLVFSDCSVADSAEDDYRFPLEKWAFRINE